MARFLVVETEASLRWVNIDHVRVIEASATLPQSTTVEFMDGSRQNFSLPVEQFLECKKIEF